MASRSRLSVAGSSLIIAPSSATPKSPEPAVGGGDARRRRFARAARRHARRRAARRRGHRDLRAQRRQRVSALGFFFALRLAPSATGPGWLEVAAALPDARPVAARTGAAAWRTIASATTMAVTVRITAD